MGRTMTQKQQLRATLLGVLSILFWSTSFAGIRSASEALGPITTAAATQGCGGLLGLTYLALRGELLALLRLPKLYLLGGGGLFVLSQVGAFLSVGLAANRMESIETSLVYYIWPGLILLFSIPIQKQKARIWIIPGVIVAFFGVMTVMTANAPDHAHQYLSGNSFIYLGAAFGACCWALYSNISRRYSETVQVNPVPLFLMVSSCSFWSLRFVLPESTILTSQAVLEVLFMGLFPTFLAHALWNCAMRRGNLTFLASLSYLTPFMSTFLSGLYLGVAPTSGLWVGCLLIVGGAVICKYSIYAPGQA